MQICYPDNRGQPSVDNQEKYQFFYQKENWRPTNLLYVLWPLVDLVVSANGTSTHIPTMSGVDLFLWRANVFSVSLIPLSSFNLTSIRARTWNFGQGPDRAPPRKTDPCAYGPHSFLSWERLYIFTLYNTFFVSFAIQTDVSSKQVVLDSH